ncbi:hypothetical protein V6N13_036303 [Hibiscus sabdariffa]
MVQNQWCTSMGLFLVLIFAMLWSSFYTGGCFFSSSSSLYRRLTVVWRYRVLNTVVHPARRTAPEKRMSLVM